MHGFIKHSLDCTEVSWAEVSHPDLLGDAPEGYCWMEVGLPATAWTVELDDEGVPSVVPFVRAAGAQVGLARIAKWSAAKKLRAAKQASGCFTDKGRVDTTQAARDNILRLVQMASIALASGTPFERNITMFDNTDVAHDAAEIVALGFAVENYIDACHAHGSSLRALINSATTVEDVEAIDIDTGWPI